MQKPQAFLAGGCRPFQKTHQPTHPTLPAGALSGRADPAMHPPTQHPPPARSKTRPSGHLRLLFRPSYTDVSSRRREGPPPRDLAAGSEVRRLGLAVGYEEEQPHARERPAREPLGPGRAGPGHPQMKWIQLSSHSPRGMCRAWLRHVRL